MLYKQLKHSNAVYSGRVGARMRPPRPRAASLSAKVPTRRDRVCGGPFGGEHLRLSIENGLPQTFVFTVRGQTGRYLGGVWHPVETL